MTSEQDLIRMKQKGILSEQEFLRALEQLKGNERRNNYQPDPEKIKRRVLFSVVLLGIFSVLTGLGLIVASNWANIPPIIKVAGGLVVLMASLAATMHFQKKNLPLWTEAFLFISFFLVGGNIALVQQSYNLELSWQTGSLIWWLFSLPLIFFTKYKLLPLCSVGLLVFSVWDIIWDMNYLLVAGIMFVIMMLTHFCKGSLAKLMRDLAFIAAIFCLYVGDVIANSGAGILGIVTTTIFLILALNTPKTTEGTVRYYNYLFLLVAWRIFILFWTAYHNLTTIGVSLIIFGTILLAGVGLYTYYFKQIQGIIKGFVRDE